MTKHEDVTKQGFSKKLGRFMARSLRAWAINRWKKPRSVIYSTDRKLG